METLLDDVRVYDADLVSPAALRAPFAHYRALRDMGPLARLAHPDVYVLSRFDAVHDALRASDTLASGKGVGFSDWFNVIGAPNLIASDGDQHQRMKAEVLRPLLPDQFRKHRAMLKAMSSERIALLVDRGPFDAMEEIARSLPTRAISVLVGLPEGAGVTLIYGATNRDEHRFPDPDRFDVRRDAWAQLSWGTNTHMSGGMHLARLEMEVMLEALVEHCAEIKAGKPGMGSNRGLYGFDSLTMSLRSVH